MQPDAIAHHRRQLPALGQSLADHHVIEPDDGALNVGDIPAQHLGGLDHATKALGQNRIERDFSKIVKETAGKRVG